MSKKSTEFWIGEYEKSLDDLKHRRHDMNPQLYKVYYDSMTSQLESLNEELKQFKDER